MTTGMSAPPMEAVRCAPNTPDSTAAEESAAMEVLMSLGSAERKTAPEARVPASRPMLMAFLPA